MRSALAALCGLFLLGTGFAQGGALSGTALKCSSTVVVSTASFRVCPPSEPDTSSCSVSSIYSDDTLVTPASNPGTVDSCGNLPAIYAAQGNYQVCYYGTGITTYCEIKNVAASSHNLLSATVTDSTAASVARGSMVAGVGASPKWTKVTSSTTNTYPKRNGSGDIVFSTLPAAGTGACTNQVPTTLNADAAPTCETVQTEDVSAGIKTRVQSITIFDPVTGDSGRVQFVIPKTATITRVWCNVKAATSATIQLNKRLEGSPDTAGTDVLTGSLVCITTGANTTSFASAGVTARAPTALTISAVSGTPDTLRVYVEYTLDDSQ